MIISEKIDFINSLKNEILIETYGTSHWKQYYLVPIRSQNNKKTWKKINEDEVKNIFDRAIIMEISKKEDYIDLHNRYDTDEKYSNRKFKPESMVFDEEYLDYNEWLTQQVKLENFKLDLKLKNAICPVCKNKNKNCVCVCDECKKTGTLNCDCLPF